MNAPADEDYGVLERRDGEVTLHFIRRLPHPPHKVWRALTEAEHLSAWFPTTVEGDTVPGAPLRFAFREMQLPTFDGTMLAFRPPELLEFSWGDERLRFELAPCCAWLPRSPRSAARPGTGLAGTPALTSLPMTCSERGRRGSKTNAGGWSTGSMLPGSGRKPRPPAPLPSGMRPTGLTATSREPRCAAYPRAARL